MPMYRFKCDVCLTTTAKLLLDNARAKAFDGTGCPSCSAGKLKRDARPASSRVTETLDNGVMARKIERPADAERLYYEHTKKNSRD